MCLGYILFKTNETIRLNIFIIVTGNRQILLKTNKRNLTVLIRIRLDCNGSASGWYLVQKFIFGKIEFVDRSVTVVDNAHYLADDFILDHFIVDITASG